jgi:preprotein translocase subunit SecA
LEDYTACHRADGSFVNECLNALKNGKKIIIGEVSDEADDLKQEFLRARGIPTEFLPPDTEVISQC